MKLSMPKKSASTQIAMKAIITLVLLITLNPIHCFCNNNDSKPYSVKVAENNVTMPSGGVITSQYDDSPSGANVSKIVDNIIKTKFITHHTKFYILWTGDLNRTVNTYSITSADDAPEKDPKSWTLSGSEDNLEWTLLDKQENQSFEKRGENKEYDFENNTPYKYYKLDVETNNGDATTQIAEWSLHINWKDIDDLMQYAERHPGIEEVPMRRYFRYKHETTDEDRTWLNDAEKDAPLPNGDNRRLTEFKVNLYPSKEPQYSDVKQYGIDNCAIGAIFASMAYCYPEFIKSIIQDNGDKTYTVSMFDPQGEPLKVSVNSKFLADKDKKIRGTVDMNNKPTWATVLEKAMMKYNYIYKISGNYDLGRIWNEAVLPFFTGSGDSYFFKDGRLSAKDIARVVKVSLDRGKLVIGGFVVAGLPIDGSKTVKGHVYTYMYSKDKDSMFFMRNPWGNNPDVGDMRKGILHIPHNCKIYPVIDIFVLEPGIAARKE
ncbi:MAG: hypothetical protein LBV43_15670 [Prevotella sp.]|jgi:hypothetical protein|nr:hypothetical protein [Prevotella sp.]